MPSDVPSDMPIEWTAGPASRRLWIDVEDLFEYARANARPSGIQRLAFEIYATLQALHGASGQIRFVRHDPARNSFRAVSWGQVAALFDGLTAAQAPRARPAPAGGIQAHPAGRQRLRKLVYRLPGPLRAAVTDALLKQSGAFRAWATLFRQLAGAVRRMPVRPPARAGDDATLADGSYETLAAPGDVLLVLGAPWSHPDYADLLRAQRARHGLRVALLVYDLIPLRRPEWCERALVRLFRAWFAGVFPLCDVVFAISRASAADAEAYAKECGIVLPGPVLPIPIGTGFGAEAATIAAPAPRNPDLPSAGGYALIVSTIEARKNHMLLFRVWRRLLDELPREQVPTLVFAGRIGWLVDDLMRQIANTDNLGGKLVIVEAPSDSDLTALYQGCLFTMFPSFFEGWGLPVTESLALGKPCLISDRTSLPEAGGGLCPSFDPDDLNDAYAVIRAAVEDRAGLDALTARVMREFRPVPWSATVDALLAGLDHPLMQAVRPGIAARPPRVSS